MSVKRITLMVLLSVLSSSLMAQTYWLNMSNTGSFEYGNDIPAVSLPTHDYSHCQEALAQYSLDNGLFNSFSCDEKPLIGAINVADQWVTN